MGIELPGELADVAGQAGVSWPQADETAMRASATAWRQAGAKITAVAKDADGTASKALTAVTGDAGNAARQHWQTFVAPDTGHLTSAAKGCADAADRLDHAADQVGAAKVRIVAHLVNLAKNADAADAAAAAGHPAALAGLHTLVQSTAGDVAQVNHSLTNSIRMDGAGTQTTPGHASPGSNGLVGDHGAPGSGGPDGLLASAGPLGDHGAPGSGGPDGLLGSNGPLGDHGVLGSAGPLGAHGALGGHGVSSPDGPLGAHGALSSDGPLGQAAPVGDHGPLGQAAPVGEHGLLGGHGALSPDGPGGPLGPGGGPPEHGGPPVDGGSTGPIAVQPGQQIGPVLAGHDPGGVPTPPIGAVAQSAAPAVAPPPAAMPAPDLTPAQHPFAAPPMAAAPTPSFGVPAPAPAPDFGGGAAPPPPAATAPPPVADRMAPAPGAPPRAAATASAVGAVVTPTPRSGAAQPASGNAGGAVLTGGRSTGPDARREAVALFLVYLFPLGQLPKAANRPDRQLPPPAEETDFAAGLRFAPHDHPDSHLMHAEPPEPAAPPEPAERLGPAKRPGPAAEQHEAAERPGAAERREAADRREAAEEPAAAERREASERIGPAERSGSAEPLGPAGQAASARPGFAAADPEVAGLAEGHDPLGGQHERDWDHRFLVRPADDTHRAEYAWPPGELFPEGGCASGEPVVLPAGTLVDRFGAPDGRVFGADGTPFARRSLPPDHLAAGYHRYRVERDLPMWRTLSAAWFGQPGGGVRYRAVYPAAELVALGYLTDITDRTDGSDSGH
jgi:nicrotizing toxin Mtb-like protein